jgi:hypothetical protein
MLQALPAALFLFLGLDSTAFLCSQKQPDWTRVGHPHLPSTGVSHLRSLGARFIDLRASPIAIGKTLPARRGTVASRRMLTPPSGRRPDY